jgi:hypothetical protein
LPSNRGEDSAMWLRSPFSERKKGRLGVKRLTWQPGIWFNRSALLTGVSRPRKRRYPLKGKNFS